MEFNRSFDNDPSAAGGPDSRPRRQEFSRLTGLLTVGEASHSVDQRSATPVVRAPESVIAAALGDQTQEAPAAKEQHSEWHSYKVDEKGQVIDQRASMGQAFLRELQPEQMMTSSSQQDDDTAATEPVEQPQAIPTQPQPSQPIQATLQPAQPANTLGQTGISSVPQTNLAAPTTQPATRASLEPFTSEPSVVQPSAQVSAFDSVVPQLPNTLPMQSRHFTPAPTTDEPLLTPGTATHVDDQHLLPAPKSRLAQFFTSPWFWLCFGLFLIFYFSVLH